MPPTMFDLPLRRVDHDHEARRASTEPVEGYVLDPWSGLYLETEVAYKHRVAPQELA
ncbi:hypothetical protein [Dyella choica]|uniref:hypothetical protein n=1 Tax=Dyella choica TaxID=1927959 RepID=UPI00131521D8|nr:hypothetical protein [Dyella choica]